MEGWREGGGGKIVIRAEDNERCLMYTIYGYIRSPYMWPISPLSAGLTSSRSRSLETLCRKPEAARCASGRARARIYSSKACTLIYNPTERPFVVWNLYWLFNTLFCDTHQPSSSIDMASVQKRQVAFMVAAFCVGYVSCATAPFKGLAAPEGVVDASINVLSDTSFEIKGLSFTAAAPGVYWWGAKVIPDLNYPHD